MTVATAIREVKIYRRGAAVVRGGSLRLEAGETPVAIAGLTASAYTDTMRLSFPAGVSASAVHIVQAERKGGESEQIAEQIAEIDDRIQGLKKQAQMWENSAGFANLKNASVEQVEAFINAYPARISANSSEIRRLEKEKKDLHEKLTKACDEENRPLISAILKTEKAGDYPFELSYQDSAAYWDSRYEIHTDGESSLNLKVRAEVRQNTGEDWKGVRMSLRTGTPVFSASLPDLRPKYLDFARPLRANGRLMGGMAPMMMAKMATADMVEENVEMMMEDTARLAPLEMEEAEVSTAGTMTEYVLGSVYDVKSADEGMFADLQSFDLKADYVIKAVPKLDIHAWLLAEVKTADLPMSVRGTASVYLNSAYTGSAELSPDFGEEKFPIALGAEERISLSRSEKKKKSSEARLKNQQSAVYEFDIQAANGKDEPVTVTIIDQIPVSRDQTISVEKIDISGAELEEKTGRLKWNVELSSHEMKTLHVEYKVSWPKDKTISSL